ncbi:hypothetical protein FIBSPDRAFT_896430 [Athelia psychrophila]|uniref:Uncharacterized protein n=1 Tax=Athelia psychrophila TaxID=1759441 RepID=A0A166DGI8_9AGAM|nr:hypothetical protein FIBSPDRAFT_896430 [Fibularhizoctonia sp. CBS 109695]
MYGALVVMLGPTAVTRARQSGAAKENALDNHRSLYHYVMSETIPESYFGQVGHGRGGNLSVVFCDDDATYTKRTVVAAPLPKRQPGAPTAVMIMITETSESELAEACALQVEERRGGPSTTV